jgi:hypothetical protein
MAIFQVATRSQLPLQLACPSSPFFPIYDEVVNWT